MAAGVPARPAGNSRQARKPVAKPARGLPRSLQVAWFIHSPDCRPNRAFALGVLVERVWRQRDSLTVHLVNLTNPMMMKGPVREFIAVGVQRLRMRLPAGRAPDAVRVLVAGTTPPFRRDGAVIEATVPSILAHEVVAIGFAGG